MYAVIETLVMGVLSHVLDPTSLSQFFTYLIDMFLILEISTSRGPVVIVNYYSTSFPIPGNLFSTWLS